MNSQHIGGKYLVGKLTSTHWNSQMLQVESCNEDKHHTPSESHLSSTWQVLIVEVFFILSDRTRSRVMKNTAKIVQSWKDKKEIG